MTLSRVNKWTCYKKNTMLCYTFSIIVVHFCKFCVHFLYSLCTLFYIFGYTFILTPVLQLLFLKTLVSPFLPFFYTFCTLFVNMWTNFVHLVTLFVNYFVYSLYTFWYTFVHFLNTFCTLLVHFFSIFSLHFLFPFCRLFGHLRYFFPTLLLTFV